VAEEGAVVSTFVFLAHISDLHVGKDAEHTESARRLARALAQLSPDWIALTGDVTENGLMAEKQAFDLAFARVRRRVTIVPGNHDRCGDNIGRFWSRAPAWIEFVPQTDVALMCLDSTQPMNNVKFMASGHLDQKQRAGVLGAVRTQAARGKVPIVLLHHHLLPLPPDGPLEFFAEWGDLPFLEEVTRGRHLVGGLAAAGAKLVLHGHKHREAQTDHGGLSVVNAGCTTELGAFRVFEVEGGDVVGVEWYGF